MPRDGIDITVLGVPELDRKLRRFERKMQRTMLSRIFRDHLRRRIRGRILAFLSGDPIRPLTGKLREAMATARVRAAARNPRRLLRIGIAWPTRAELGIDSDDPHFYPAALEYGHKGAPAHPFIRPAIDNYRRLDVRRIARMLKKAIRREGGE